MHGKCFFLKPFDSCVRQNWPWWNLLKIGSAGPSHILIFCIEEGQSASHLLSFAHCWTAYLVGIWEIASVITTWCRQADNVLIWPREISLSGTIQVKLKNIHCLLQDLQTGIINVAQDWKAATRSTAWKKRFPHELNYDNCSLGKNKTTKNQILSS